jgi:hypothetical protein
MPCNQELLKNVGIKIQPLAREKKKEYESPHHVIDALQKLWRLGEKANVCRRRGDAGGPRPSMSLVDWEWLGDIVLQPLRALARPVRVAV